MFKEARLKLTGWYLLIIMVISLAFSGVIYGMISQEMERFVRSPRFRESQIPIIEKEIVEESQKRLIWSLIEINGVILLISGTLGYVLAGKTLSPIQKMLEEQKRFVGDASHELRTPLTALKSMLEVGLRDKKMDLKEARKLISESIEETDKLKKLSDSLLELARENSNGKKLAIEKVKVKEIVEEAVKQIKVTALRKKIKIIYKGNGTIVMGNKDKLTELLVILLDNAVKYSLEGKQIEINSRGGERKGVIKIKDRGVGIAAKDLEHIFERFYRTDSARARGEKGGYGLGLAIAKKIVEEHNGKITVTSEINKGSEFKISLPSFS